MNNTTDVELAVIDPHKVRSTCVIPETRQILFEILTSIHDTFPCKIVEKRTLLPCAKRCTDICLSTLSVPKGSIMSKQIYTRTFSRWLDADVCTILQEHLQRAKRNVYKQLNHRKQALTESRIMFVSYSVTTAKHTYTCINFWKDDFHPSGFNVWKLWNITEEISLDVIFGHIQSLGAFKPLVQAKICVGL